jgi:hypothetical protein
MKHDGFSQDTQVVHAMGFSPLDPINIPIGWLQVKLYPKNVPSMLVHKRAHAFQVNKSALKVLPTDLQLVIDTFGSQLNASLAIEEILSDWRQFFNK